MTKQVALFNYNGGFNKTTTTYNLGWALAAKGKKVILVDADPQCNLTKLIIGADNFDRFYEEQPERNIRAGLSPAFDARPVAIKPIECVQVRDCENLLLLPGHTLLSEYEITLGIAQSPLTYVQTLQNLPGSIAYLLKRTAEQYDVDFVLVETSSSLGAINQNILMTSDFFLIPAAADQFSVTEINFMAKFLPTWYKWAKDVYKLPIFETAIYPFSEVVVKFLGLVIQNEHNTAEDFQGWLDKIVTTVAQKLEPRLKESNMLLPESIYHKYGLKKGLCLATINQSFNSANSEKSSLDSFSELAEKIIGLAEEAIKLRTETIGTVNAVGY